MRCFSGEDVDILFAQYEHPQLLYCKDVIEQSTKNRKEQGKPL